MVTPAPVPARMPSGSGTTHQWRRSAGFRPALVSLIRSFLWFSSRSSPLGGPPSLLAGFSVSVGKRAPHRRWRRAPLGFSEPWARSLDQRLVGEPLPDNAVNETVEPLERMPLDVAFVQPERKFINVPAKMLWTRVMVDADQPALQDRENALDAVGRYVVADEFGSAVVDGFMIEEQTSEATVSRELVGVQRRAGLDVPMDCAMNGGLVGAFDRHRNRPAAALAHPTNPRLADRAAPRLQLLVLVFVGLDAADIGFVALADAG